MAAPRQLIDWHTHCFLPEHVDPASAAAMRARGLSWGDAGPEHQRLGLD